jgi:hypothetical protein
MFVLYGGGGLPVSSPRGRRKYRFPSFFCFVTVEFVGLFSTAFFCVAFVFSAKTGNFVMSSAARKQILRKPFESNVYEVVNGGKVK